MEKRKRFRATNYSRESKKRAPVRGVQCVYIHVTRERARLGQIYISEALKSLQRALGAFSVWMKFRDGDAGVVTGHFIPASRPGASSGRESAGETTLFSRAETSACRRIDAHTHSFCGQGRRAAFFGRQSCCSS